MAPLLRHDEATAAAIVPADGHLAAVRIAVVVLLDPVAVPAVRAVVVGERAGLEIVAHVGGGLRGDLRVGRDLFDAASRRARAHAARR